MLPALRLLMWGIAIALVVAAALAWPALPDRIPTHFDAVGQPDAWGDRSLALWLLMPLLAVASSALMDWSAQTIRRRPESPLVNLPYKDQVLALPSEPRATVLSWQAIAIYVAGVSIVVALALVQASIWTTAHGADGATLNNVAVGLALVAPLAAVGVAALRTRDVVGDA